MKDAVLFESRGAGTRSVPSVQFVDPDSWSDCDAAILRIKNYDAILFTSRNAVEFFLRRIQVTAPAARPVVGSRRVYAIGERTQEALEESGINVTGISELASAEGLADVIGGEAAGKRFLFPKSNIAREVLPDSLRELDAVVDEVVVYKTVAPGGRELDAVRDSLLNRAIDAITFFSPSAVRNFTQMIGTAHLANVPIAAIGPTTAEAIRQAGLDVAVVSPTPATQSLVEALELFFSQQTQQTDDE